MDFDQFNLGQHMPYFMHLRQMVLKKKISIFFCVFLWLKPRTSILSSGCHFVLWSGTVLAIFIL